MIAGTWFVLHGELTAGGFVGFLLLIGVFFRPVDKINSVMETYPKGIAGFRRYTELLDTEPDIVDAPGAVAVIGLRGEIRYEGVSFGYTPGRPVLDGIDLAIAAGETVAFVGPSGAGKTTICSLLPRFYDVEAGRITIDGIDIRDDDAGFPARPDRHRAAGRVPVRGHHPRQHRLWPPRRRRSRHRRCGPPRPPGRRPSPACRPVWTR